MIRYSGAAFTLFLQQSMNKLEKKTKWWLLSWRQKASKSENCIRNFLNVNSVRTGAKKFRRVGCIVKHINCFLSNLGEDVMWQKPKKKVLGSNTLTLLSCVFFFNFVITETTYIINFMRLIDPLLTWSKNKTSGNKFEFVESAPLLNSFSDGDLYLRPLHWLTTQNK